MAGVLSEGNNVSKDFFENIFPPDWWWDSHLKGNAYYNTSKQVVSVGEHSWNVIIAFPVLRLHHHVYMQTCSGERDQIWETLD